MEPGERAAPTPWLNGVGWIWTVLAALAAFGCVSDSIWLGVLFFVISGLLVAPPLVGHYRDHGVKDVVRRVASAGAAFGGFVAIGSSAAPQAAVEPAVKSPSTANAAPAVDDRATAKADLQATWNKILEAGGPCDKSNSAAADAIGAVEKGTRTVYDVYGIAKQAHEQCRSAAIDIGELEAPGSLPEKEKEMVAEALERCNIGYVARQESLETMLKVLDGDARPSVVQQFQETAKRAQAGQILCASGIVTAAASLGLNLKPD